MIAPSPRSGAIVLAALGDSRLLDTRSVQVTEADLARLFGPEFASALRNLPVGEWEGPLSSGYGAHLVRIEERTTGRAVELSEVREAVARDWSARRRQELLDAQYEALLSRYQIRIQGQ